jgi:TolB-like protein
MAVSPSPRRLPFNNPAVAASPRRSEPFLRLCSDHDLRDMTLSPQVQGSPERLGNTSQLPLTTRKQHVDNIRQVAGFQSRIMAEVAGQEQQRSRELIPEEAVRRHLEEIVSSKPFAGSERLRRFLRYLVEQTLAGQGALLKEYTVGLDVFQRGPDYDPQVDSTVRVHAGKLRDKLREYYLTEGRDATVRIELPKGSYVPAFRLEEAPPPAIMTAGDQPDRPRPEDTVAALPPEPPQAGKQGRKQKFLLLLGVLAIGTATGWFVYTRTNEPATVNQDSRSIVVLPFRDLSLEKDQEYFCDGMTEEIISALSSIDGLHVVASTSAFAFKGKPQDVRTIASQLNVGTVLEGSVRKSGNRIRITTQLVSANDGRHLWRETYDRELTDIFGTQDEIARSIAGALSVSLSRRNDVRPQTANIDAYNAYLQGRHHWYKRNEAGLRAAAAYFQQAVELDPRYARAWAGLADVYVQLDGWEFERPHEAMPKAKEYVNRALSLEPLLAEAYVSLGAVYLSYDWDPQAAGREYARAVALDPGYITGHWWYACWLEASGREMEARQEFDRALKLDPLSVPVLIDAGLWHGASERFDLALSLCRKAMEIDPLQSLAYRCLGNTLEALGRTQEASVSFTKAVDLAPDYPAALADLAGVRVREGRRAEAQQILNRLLSMQHTRYVPAFVIARTYFHLGDQPAAMSWLRRAREERSPRFGWYVVAQGKHRVYDYVSRNDPVFTDLIVKVLAEQK